MDSMSKCGCDSTRKKLRMSLGRQDRGLGARAQQVCWLHKTCTPVSDDFSIAASAPSGSRSVVSSSLPAWCQTCIRLAAQTPTQGPTNFSGLVLRDISQAGLPALAVDISQARAVVTGEAVCWELAGLCSLPNTAQSVYLTAGCSNM